MNREIQVASALNTTASRTLGIKDYKGNKHTPQKKYFKQFRFLHSSLIIKYMNLIPDGNAAFGLLQREHHTIQTQPSRNIYKLRIPIHTLTAK